MVTLRLAGRALARLRRRPHIAAIADLFGFGLTGTHVYGSWNLYVAR
jgi:hypothetical protein